MDRRVTSAIMGWFRDHHLAVSTGAFLVFGSMLALVLGYVGLVLSSAFWSVSGQSVVGVLLDLAIPYLPIIAVLLIATIGSVVSLGWAVLRRLSLPRSDRLHSTAERIEQSSSILDTLSLSDFVAPPEPSEEEKLETLKQQYVRGDISEAEFERKIDQLTASESMDDTPPSAMRESREADREW
jgi:uncharacterized membrane protein